MEQHAFAVGEIFAAVVLEYVSSKEFQRNPYNESIVQQEYEAAISGKGPSHICINSDPSSADHADPYRHYYAAQIERRKLTRAGGGHANDQAWIFAVEHYRTALTVGEYLQYDQRPAMESLCDLAGNRFFDESKKPPRQIQVPNRTQEMAKNILESFANKTGSRFALTAKGFLRRLEKMGPLPPSKVSSEIVQRRPQLS